MEQQLCRLSGLRILQSASLLSSRGSHCTHLSCLRNNRFFFRRKSDQDRRCPACGTWINRAVSTNHVQGFLQCDEFTQHTETLSYPKYQPLVWFKPWPIFDENHNFESYPSLKQHRKKFKFRNPLVLLRALRKSSHQKSKRNFLAGKLIYLLENQRKERHKARLFWLRRQIRQD